MTLHNTTVFAAFAAVAATFAAPLPAQAAVTVLGNELGYACAVAALAGYADDASVDTCTLALTSPTLSTRDRAGTYVNRGVIQLRRKVYARAHADFDTAVTIAPTLGEAYVNRGAAYVAQRRYEEGMTEISRGLALGADEPEKAYYNRALAHEGLGDLKSAYLDYQQALQLKPGWADPERNLARFMVRIR